MGITGVVRTVNRYVMQEVVSMYRIQVTRLLGLIPTAILFTVAGCGGGGGGSSPTPLPINSPPTAAIVQPDRTPITLDVKSAQSLELKVKVNDPDGGKLQCVWSWDAGKVTPAEQNDVDAGYEVTASFQPPAYDGPCHVTMTVSDGQASATAAFTIQVTGNDVQPSGQLRITGMTLDPDPVSPSQNGTVSASVENPGNKDLTYQWSARRGSITGTGSSATWTAPDVPGVYGVYLTVSDGTTTVTSGKAMTVAGPGGGLRGEYFKTKREKNNVILDQLVMTRIDPLINFYWDKLSPDTSKLPSNEGWGARWTGYIKCEQAGTYVFRVHADDGARMKIQNDNGEWVWVIPGNDADWTDHDKGAWLPNELQPVELQGGKWYPVQLEFFQGAQNAFITMFWSVSGGPETMIEQDNLKPPS